MNIKKEDRDRVKLDIYCEKLGNSNAAHHHCRIYDYLVFIILIYIYIFTLCVHTHALGCACHNMCVMCVYLLFFR